MATRRRNRRVKTTVGYYGPRDNPFTAIKKDFKRDGIREAQEIVHDEGDYLAAEVQMYISNQMGAKWPELNEQYYNWKITHDLDSRKLIASGDYYVAIKARWRSGRTVTEVGLPDGNHPGSDLPFKELGRILEYGHKGFQQIGEGLIPPRPHWRPVWLKWRKRGKEKLAKKLEKEVAEAVFTRVKRQLKRKTVKL